MVQRNKPTDSVTEVVNTTQEVNKDPVPDTTIQDVSNENETSKAVETEPKVIVEPEKKDVNVQQVAQEKPAVKPETTPQQTEPVKPEATPVVKREAEQPVTVAAPTPEEINAEYEALITSGKSKMAAADVSGRKADFTKATEEISAASTDFSNAAKLKTTDELIDLIGKCKVKEEEILLAGRKALYEEIKSFGELIIVMKKDTKKYGAIDAKAQERIKCKYLVVYKTQQDYRAFLREDDLFDIYNDEGVLISEGLPGYY